jgi:hypothetical protein
MASKGCKGFSPNDPFLYACTGFTPINGFFPFHFLTIHAKSKHAQIQPLIMRPYFSRECCYLSQRFMILMLAHNATALFTFSCQQWATGRLQPRAVFKRVGKMQSIIPMRAL